MVRHMGNMNKQVVMVNQPKQVLQQLLLMVLHKVMDKPVMEILLQLSQVMVNKHLLEIMEVLNIQLLLHLRRNQLTVLLVMDSKVMDNLKHLKVNMVPLSLNLARL